MQQRPQVLSPAYDFWKDKSINQIYFSLRDLMESNATPAGLPALLESISKRLNQLATPDLLNSCFYFILDAQNSGNIGRGVVGEKYLQLTAWVNHELGHTEFSSRVASILCDIYALRGERNHAKFKRFQRMTSSDTPDNNEDVLNHLVEVTKEFFQEYLLAQSYQYQSDALRDMVDHLRSVKRTDRTPNNPYTLFEAESVEDSKVETTVLIRCLNDDYMRRMTEKDFEVLVELDEIFPRNQFQLLELFNRYDEVVQGKPKALREMINQFVETRALKQLGEQFEVYFKK